MDIRNLKVFLSDSACYNDFGISLMYNKNTRKLYLMEEDRTTTLIAEAGITNSLNTPYHTLKMQQLGIYEDFVSYMDSQHEYEKEQKASELAKQEAYQLALAENSELVYEDWLSSYPELMPVHQEPVPSERLMEFYNEYK